ncbi:uncharacterized protein TNCV_254491 [Trichonephila clavipes]|nr:uncharacterized protein TNCV_254491 [Trichonephila clavipes]
MEAFGAFRTLERSLIKQDLQCTEYYGDGDSKGFLQVKDIYGDNSVTKLECIGHIQKKITRWLLATDHVILNHGQVTWMTPELAPTFLTTTPSGGRFSSRQCGFAIWNLRMEEQMCEMKKERFRWEVSDHPPYSPDLAPSDFHPYEPLKKHLRGQHFKTNARVQQTI